MLPLLMFILHTRHHVKYIIHGKVCRTLWGPVVFVFSSQMKKTKSPERLGNFPRSRGVLVSWHMGVKALIYMVCQFLPCNWSQPGWFQIISVMSVNTMLGRAAHNQLSWSSRRWLWYSTVKIISIIESWRARIWAPGCLQSPSFKPSYNNAFWHNKLFTWKITKDHEGLQYL